MARLGDWSSGWFMENRNKSSMRIGQAHWARMVGEYSGGVAEGDDPKARITNACRCGRLMRC